MWLLAAFAINATCTPQTGCEPPDAWQCVRCPITLDARPSRREAEIALFGDESEAGCMEAKALAIGTPGESVCVETDVDIDGYPIVTCLGDTWLPPTTNLQPSGRNVLIGCEAR